MDEAEAEVLDAAGGAGGLGLPLEGEDVVAARPLHLDAALVAVVLLDAEDVPVEAQRAFGVADGETDVRQSVCLDHRSSFVHGRSLAGTIAHVSRGRQAGR